MRPALLLLGGLLLAGGAARGQASPPPDRRPHPLQGAWHVEGTARFRYLSRPDGRLCLAGVWDEALGPVELRERPAAPGAGRGGWWLEGAGLDPRAPRLTLELRQAEDGALEAVLREGVRSRAPERWWRVGSPRLALERATPDGAGLELRFTVQGRPQSVTVRVQAPDDARYAHLGGVVHEERLLGGEALLVGVYHLRWDGRDRSPGARPVLPGRYRVELLAAEDGLAAAAEDASAAREVQLGPPPRPLVFRGAIQALVPAAPAPAPVAPQDPESY